MEQPEQQLGSEGALAICHGGSVEFDLRLAMAIVANKFTARDSFESKGHLVIVSVLELSKTATNAHMIPEKRLDFRSPPRSMMMVEP